MESHEPEFNLTYSILLEQMHSVLFGRLDRFCTFAQLFLGTAVATDAASPIVSGLFVAFLAAIQITYQPSAKSAEAKLQLARYLEIRKRAPSLTPEQVQDEINSIAISDSEAVGALTHPAWLATAIQTGRPIDDAEWRKMTHLQAVASWFAGNHPKKAP